MFGQFHYRNGSDADAGIPAPHRYSQRESRVLQPLVRLRAGGFFVLGCLALVIFSSLLLLASGVKAAAPPSLPSGGAQTVPNSNTGPLAPNACGNVWATLTAYPTTISSQATAALNGMLYSFGGISTSDTAASYRYDPVANTWTSITSLPASRSGASAVTDGTYIYIMGGTISGNQTNTVYRYDPVANTYATMAAMPLITVWQAAAYLNGKIYRIGGCNPGNCSFATGQVDVYTVATNTWASGPAYPIGVSYASAVVRGGFIYVAGGKDGNGQDTNKTYRLDPTTNLWDDASIADLPATRRETAGDMLNGRWLLAGGRDISGNLLGAIAWDPATNTWSTVSGMPTPAFVPGAATVGTTFYVVGGDAFGRTNQLRSYSENPACTTTPTSTASATSTSTPTLPGTQTNTPTVTPTATVPCGNVWTTLAPYPATVSNAAVVAFNGSLYSFGGIVINSDSAVAYRYSPGTDTWTAIASLPQARSAASAVSDGTYIYIVAGSIAGNLTNTLYRYDPVANTYATLAPMLNSTSKQAAVYLNGKIYRIGGCLAAGCSSGTATVEIYTIITNTWAAGPVYPQSVNAPSAITTLDGRIAVAGGNPGTGAITKTYRFDPATNVWDDASIADLPVGRQESAGDMLNGRWLLAGGRDTNGSLLAAIAWDPATNTWSNLAAMPTPVFSAGAGTIGTSFYVVGGDAFGRTNLTRRYTEGTACTATPSPTLSPTNSPTNTVTVTPSFTRTSTPTNSPTSTVTNTPTNSPTNTNTPVPTDTPTGTATPTLTVTVTPTPAGMLVGHVTWQGRLAQPNALQQLPITLTLKSATAEANYPVQNTDASGFFTVTVSGLPNGTYNWRVKGPDGVVKTLTTDPPGFLANAGTLSLVGAPNMQVEMGLMKAGDCNNDNLVSVQDFNALKNTFGKSAGNTGYDRRADFNGDTTITVQDFNLLKGNFGQAGSPPLGPSGGPGGK